jgi:signal transduction histidine kinase/CheY-like chemotaxis protein
MIIKKNRQNPPKLFNIVEELKDGFCTIDNKGDFIYYNLAARDLMQLNNSEKYNFFINIVRDEKQIDSINSYLKNNEFMKDFDIDLYNGEDVKFPALISVTKIKDPNNNIIGMSILIKDMTYIKQVQQQLFQAQKMESIGMLASGVAHEFNNILTGIIPNAELIKLTTNTDNANYQRADSIQKSANRASEIVKKLLNFARNESIQRTESTDFIRVVQDTLDILKRLFDRKIEFEFRYNDNLYNAKIDDTSIQQIIMNLSINAKDAIKETGKISLIAENYIVDIKNINSGTKLDIGKYIRFIISDTGHGMDKDQQKYIFDPFYTTKEPGKGTGLGLSMVYGIIKACNGAISVESEIGLGTKFTVFLPATERAPKNDISEFTQNSIGIGHSILVVDDEEIIAEMATDMLESIGFKVFSATNGYDGLEMYKLNHGSIDIVLLDLLMPGMDGISCFRHLKTIDNNVKVIISSGIGEHSQKEDLFKMGISGYLEKPYSLKKISKELENLLLKNK